MRVSLVALALSSLALPTLAQPVTAPLPAAAPAILNTPIATGPGHQVYPDVSDYENDHFVAYMSNASGNWDIWYYDLLDGKNRQLTSDPGNQLHPGLMHDEIVWEEFKSDGGGWDIYYANTTTGDRRRLSLPGDQRWPEVSHGTVTFQDNRPGNWDIVQWEVATGKTNTLAGGPGDQALPSVRHSAIVWEDTRNGNADVYAWDIFGKMERAIATGAPLQRAPYVQIGRASCRERV